MQGEDTKEIDTEIPPRDQEITLREETTMAGERETSPAKDSTVPIIAPEKDHHALEIAKCGMSPGYFIDNYCQIEDPNRPGTAWYDFKLWSAQREAIKVVHKNNKVVILKARQLGITWLLIGYSLWLMVFKPGSMILLFSKNGEDSRELARRIAGMWERLPDWIRPEADKVLEQQLILKNGSRAKSFMTTKHSGRSFTASFVLIDEGAFIPFLKQLLNAAEETADAGGKLAIISTNDKEVPNNNFAALYRRSVKGESDYIPLFLPWYARPSRDQAWYAHKLKTKEQDDLWQEYPEIPSQALAGLSANKRFLPSWIKAATREADPLSRLGRAGLPRIPGIVYYETILLGRPYLITADPAEGDTVNDPSAVAIWDALLFEEVAYAEGAWEPSTFAGYIYRLAQAFNQATVCVERNNHGHAVQLALRDLYDYKWLYKNPFDNKTGWLTTQRTKTLAMDKLAELMEIGELGIKSPIILAQIANIDASTQAAPEGDHDDAAMVAVLAAAALTWTSKRKRQRRRRLHSLTI